jgi:hypothetical protein
MFFKMRVVLTDFWLDLLSDSRRGMKSPEIKFALFEHL